MNQSSNDLFEMIDNYIDHEGSADQFEQLQARLAQDSEHVSQFVRQVFLHQQLRELLVAERLATALEVVRHPRSSSVDSGISADGFFWTPVKRVAEALPLVTIARATVLCVLVFYAVKGAFGPGIYSSGYVTPATSPAQGPQASVAVDTPARFSATLTPISYCVFDPSSAPVSAGRQAPLRPGQAISLIEGVAKIDASQPLGGRGSFVLEGPLSLFLDAEGMPSLQHGKLYARFKCDRDRFRIDTPLGKILVSWNTELGILATADEVAVHIFSGAASFEPILVISGDPQRRELYRVSSGEMLKLKAASDENIEIERGPAVEDAFVTNISMSAYHLTIMPEYVQAVRKASPDAYWRFESAQNGFVPNEMSDRYRCHIEGSVGWHNYPGNRTVEFGAFDKGGCLVSTDTFPPVSEYTVEAWIKPSHFHLGTILTFVDHAVKRNKHGLLLELCGPALIRDYTASSKNYHPGRIRFLHRSDVGKLHSGVSTFSRQPYKLRQWQYVVGVKDKTRLRLYVDGNQVSSSKDSRPLAEGLSVIIGQLQPPSTSVFASSRSFLGEIDEVAWYPHALSEEEIRKHFELVNP